MRTPRLFHVATSALLLALVTLIAPAASAQSFHRGDKLDTKLQQRARQLNGRTRVIVQFKGDADVRVFGRRTATGRRLGRRAQVAELDNIDLARLASDPRVERVMLDRPAFAMLERASKAVSAKATRMEFGVAGRGVGVAIIDSGINASHNDLYRRVSHFRDFTNEQGPSSQARDGYGHGTHVAGIVAGTGSDSDGKNRGMAPSAKLIGLKVLDSNGRGYISDVIAAIDYAISVKATYNVRVINLSVGSGVYESYWLDPLTLAAQRAVDAGIVVVAAAGNLGQNALGDLQTGAITSPGNAPWVLTVGASSHQGTAVRSDDVMGRFSSRGPTWVDFATKPDVVAPGVGIVSTSDPSGRLYATLPELRVDGTRGLSYKSYLSLSGTSMAAPVVAGTVALMLEANPALTPNSVKAILQYTAQTLPDESPLAQGAGLVNAHGAVRLARFFASPIGGIGQMSDTIEGESVEWARHIIWGNFRITGGVLLPDSNAWTTGLNWGALDTAFGTPVVWGARADDNIVWSTARDEDDNIVWSTARIDDSGNIVWSTARADDDNIVWSTARDEDNIVWSTAAGDDNIVWSTALANDDNIVWSTATAENVVWGTDCGGLNCAQVVWGSEHDGTTWGTAAADDNIVWSTAADDNIVWSTAGPSDDNIVWSTAADDNIVWSTAAADDDNIVWSTADDDSVVWDASTDADAVEVIEDYYEAP